MTEALTVLQLQAGTQLAAFGLLLFAAGIFSAYRTPKHSRPNGPAGVLVYVGGLSLMLGAGGAFGRSLVLMAAAWLLLGALTQTFEAARSFAKA